ncbi:MAG: IS200/IS605 family transposase [Cytophagales bacterium]|nr:MAG: IS200/IS605 family transposase [Cytophagales bacterium]
MANTYTQLYVQLVFAVKGRQHLIPKSRKEELHQYITGIVQKRGQKLLAVHCMPDHAHVFVGFGPTLTIADLVKDIKQATSVWIKEKGIAPATFSWQEGYGAFTYAQSQVKDVVHYVLNQEERHRVKTFQEEYLAFLERFEVPYDKRYVFEFYTPEASDPSEP